jgi:hypothetical protein
VRVGAIKPHAGVEVEFVAAEPPSLVPQPIQQQPSVPATACSLERREVIGVQEVAPGQIVSDAVPGDGGGIAGISLERPYQPVLLGPQRLVDRPDE